MGLGPIHAVNLEEARESARKARQLLLDGFDPLVERRRERDQKRAEAAARQTFREVAEDFLAVHLDTFKNVKHRQQWQSTLAVYAFPKLGDRDIASITDALISETLAPIWTKVPETAGRVKQRVERILQWQKDGRPLPTRGVKKVRHHPSMQIDQVPEFMAALRKREGIAARALEFTILCAARTGEVIGATWDEIDFENKVWIISSSRMKAGKEHRVPLSSAAVDLLRQLPREDENDFVFIGARSGRGLSNMSLSMVLRHMGRDDVTVHGFRSSARDWVAERTNYPNIVGEAMLAHVVKGVEGDYRRGDLLAKRRRMMTDWATFCMSPRPAANVTDIGAARKAKKA